MTEYHENLDWCPRRQSYINKNHDYCRNACMIKIATCLNHLNQHWYIEP